MKQINSEERDEAALYSPLTLAYLGDAVFELLVREYLVQKGNVSSNKLHHEAVLIVRCKAQSEAADSLMPIFTDEERAIFLRGRNANPNSIPKKADRADYHRATGLEAVFGYLHLKNKNERIRELFELIIKQKAE